MMVLIPFSGSRLDRASDRRTDASWIAGLRHDPHTLIWPFWHLQPLLFGRKDEQGAVAGYLNREAVSRLHVDWPTVFLGLDEGRAIFAQDVSVMEPEQHAIVGSSGFFCEARAAAQLLSANDTAILGHAKPLIDWHARHQFCPNCGARTVLMDAGYRRHCKSCGADHFPRTDPVVIMLATHGDSCLVGRAPRFTEGMFSALAGFVEPGETVEEAVAREVYEEAGVRVRDVTYFAAQPWPFPSSLMIGCFAKAESRELRIDGNELAEAFWLSRANLRALFAGEQVGNLRVPAPVAIAHHLLRRFAELPQG